MIRVVFVGSNPSVSAKTLDPFCPSTRSGRILRDWISRSCDSCSCVFMNVQDNPTSCNRPLTKSEILSNLDSLKKKIEDIRPHKIVSLGRAADTALTLLRLPHFDMPHPSGLNRKLNDNKFIEEKINGLRTYILSPHLYSNI